ncbi:MAG: hypothetical protein JWM36_4329 [Hyphomicrobiales bacterium]|nr:hypothetical protein [Hyphomicrobiales bacterium]
MTQIVLTSGASWTVPSDCSKIDKVEAIGSTAASSSNATGTGGGAYSQEVNLAVTPGSTLSYLVGTGGSDTWFGASTFAASLCGAKGTATSTGGAAASGIGSLIYSGGNAAKGGGGAAGPHGNGFSGVSTSGGAGDAGFGGTGAAEGSPGGSGTQWGAYGCGGGGGNGGAGGSYGGGAGCLRSGSSGLIIITYTPVTYTTGTGASSGSGAAVASGQSLKFAVGVSAGAATASAMGQAIALPPGSGNGYAAGIATATATARPIASGAGASAGHASADSPTATAGVGTGSGHATVSGKAPPPLPGPCRILIGKIPGANYGIRISQTGYNAASNPVDQEKLLFNSDWGEIMPIHQVGSFVHRTTAQQGTEVNQLVSYPTLGYVPFVEFYAQGNGDALPAGSDIWPAGGYYDRKTMQSGGQALLYWGPYFSGDSTAFLRLNISSTQVRAQSWVRNLSGNNSQGAPRTWTIYYVIYRKQAF